MKIIKQGKNLDEVASIKFECSGCECVFEANIDDIIINKVLSTAERLPGMSDCSVRCPCCNNIIIIEDEKIEYGSKIYNQIREKRKKQN